MDVKAIDGIALARSATAVPRGGPSGAVVETGGDSAAADAVSAGGTPAGGTAAASGFIYISPIVRYDQAARLAVLFYRDPDTGETRDQIPNEQVVDQYRRAHLTHEAGSGQGTTTGRADAGARTEAGAGDGSAGFSTPGKRSGSGAATALYQAAAALAGQGGGAVAPSGGTGGPASPAGAAFGSAAAGAGTSGGRVSVTV